MGTATVRHHHHNAHRTDPAVTMSRELTDYLNANYRELSRVIVTNRKGKKVPVLNARTTTALAYMIADGANLAGLFWYGQRAIGEHIGVHQREVQEHLAKLVEAGFIAKVGTRSYNGAPPSDEYLVTFGRQTAGYIPTLETDRHMGTPTGIAQSKPKPYAPGKNARTAPVRRNPDPAKKEKNRTRTGDVSDQVPTQLRPTAGVAKGGSALDRDAQDCNSTHTPNGRYFVLQARRADDRDRLDSLLDTGQYAPGDDPNDPVFLI